jgi:5-oxoprolinase (ATP-hydrolysing)
MARDFRFSVDRGGTFTDVYAEFIDAAGRPARRVLKLLSVDPGNYPDAPREGIRRVLEAATGVAHPRGVPLDTARIASIRMGTTVATNALLERRGERVALAVTAGFRDLLHIGNQSRPDIFDLEVQVPPVLYEAVVEVDEAVIVPLGGAPSARSGPDPAAAAAAFAATPGGAGARAVAATGEAVLVRRAPDLGALRAALAPVRAAGIASLAVVLKHAAIFPDHELAVGELAKELGFSHVALSHAVSPMVRMVPRGFTAAADAYLTPAIMRYVADFEAGFDAGLRSVPVHFMQSDGGLADAAAFSGHRAVLSGPAGGYVGYAATTRWAGAPPPRQVVGFDMGGTSTDVSRFAGALEHVFEAAVAGVAIQAPQLDINTVAAGGGSRLFFEGGALRVGPESAGAHPGPVCYRKPGGLLALTDANLALGRVLPQFFPRVFGATEDQPLDAAGARAAVEALAARVNAAGAAAGRPAMGADEVAMGAVRVANEAMCRPIRALTQMKGHDVARHVLAVFGGAGGQHACAVAAALGVRTVFVHRFAGVLSAVGIGLAEVVAEAREPAAEALGAPGAAARLEARLGALEARARRALAARGAPPGAAVAAERFLNLRYEGTDVAVMTPAPPGGDAAAAFEAAYRREFGFALEGRAVVVDDLRVRAAAAGAGLAEPGAPPGEPGPLPPPAAVAEAYFERGGRLATPAHRLAELRPGHALPGPAIVIDEISTVLVEPGWTAHVTAAGDLRLEADSCGGAGAASSTSSTSDAAAAAAIAAAPADPVALAVFAHRFMGIAEQMGRALQRTSVSVNIKERLDFSCALFDAGGNLVSNAPHLPVHLGAMSAAVKAQIRLAAAAETAGGRGLAEGDVLMSNHPQLAGGSHLPDITVITPVFASGELAFFVAARGHHADIGGVAPGSMPPHSTRLAEEGAAIVSFRLVEGGVFQEAGAAALLTAGDPSVPGAVGTRCLADNLSDLRAQVAANARGIALVTELIAEHSLPVVRAYMGHIQAAAEAAVREMLVAFSLAAGLPEVGTVRAEDQMDDGSPIALAVTIDRRDGSAIFDFAGTGPQVLGNANAPPAVTRSAVIYALRSLVAREVPLNHGCLAPVEVRIPEGSLLAPGPEAAVVGGNVLTSQVCLGGILLFYVFIAFYFIVCTPLSAAPFYFAFCAIVSTLTHPNHPHQHSA